MENAKLFARLKELQKANTDLKMKNGVLRNQKKYASKLCTSLFQYTLPTSSFSDLDFDIEVPKELIGINPRRALRHTPLRHNEHNHNYGSGWRRGQHDQKHADSDLDDDSLEEVEENKPRLSENLVYAASLPPFEPRESRDYSDCNFWKETYPDLSDLGNLDGSPPNEIEMFTKKPTKPKFEKKDKYTPRTRRYDCRAPPQEVTPRRFNPYYSPMMSAQNTMCKFFASGYGKCYQGENCRFMHMLSPSLSPMLAPSPYIEPSASIAPGMGNFSLDRRDSETVSPFTSSGEKQMEKNKSISFWKDMGKKQIEQKQFDAAAHSYSQVLRFTYDIDSHWKRGLIYRLQGNYYHASRYPSLKQKALTLHNKAAQDFSKVIKTSPSKSNRAYAYLCRADGFAKRGFWDLAMSDVNEHLRQKKSGKARKEEGIMAMLLNINGFALRGDINVALKENQKAIQDYKKAMQSDPANREKYNQAIKNLRKAKS